MQTKFTEFDVLGTPKLIHKGKAIIIYEIEKADNHTLIFSSKTIFGVEEKLDSRVKTIDNLKFPPVVNDINDYSNPISVIIKILSMIKLNYKIDLNNNHIECLNIENTLIEAGNIMKAKGYNESFIAKGMDFMKKENAIWQRIHEANQFILYFNQSAKTNNELLKSQFLDKTFQLSEDDEYTYGEKPVRAGTSFAKAVISKKHGFVLNYYNARFHK